MPPAKRAKTGVQPQDFVIYPSFATLDEQRQLLDAGLRKLDRTLSSSAARKLKKQHGDAHRDTEGFLPAAAYEFQPSHFDGVIDSYRECSLTELPGAPTSLLSRLYAMFPSLDPPEKFSVVPPGLVMHLLHLAPHGSIRPHVDNVAASADTILGLSLGSTRVMNLRYKDDPGISFRVAMPPGSVYVQRGTIRYAFEHDIPVKAAFRGYREPVGGLQRLSLMLRDRLSHA